MSESGASPAVAGRAATPAARRLPIGAEVLGDGRVHFRVWAPAADRVEVVFAGQNAGQDHSVPLEPVGSGYHAGMAHARIGARYRFRLDGAAPLYPDPASRFQPEGPLGPSEIVDPGAFEWTDAGWRGAALPGQVLYELHVGTFTREGTWDAAARELPDLADTGLTVVEVMPVAEFAGRFGWGYDGVDLYAPSHLYGRPDDFRAFVDRAHRLGLAVILDVVYNHVGAVGNHLRSFSPSYFTDRYDNEWGEAINFDGEDAGPVREFFVENAGYWIDEFHLDGLRLDATQQIFDRSARHVVVEVGAQVRAKARGRATILVAENEPQDPAIARPVEGGGYGLDGLWNDDFHHSATVAVTGRAEAYYSDTRGDAQELLSAAKYGFLFQGRYYFWQQKRRGGPALDLPPSAFVTFLQNHDQVANSARGARGHQVTSPSRWRAITALLLLMPGTPMLFQGQEFAASTPFLYFADLEPAIAESVRRGRAEFLTQFPGIVGYCAAAPLDDPGDARTFERCQLDRSERRTHGAALALHRDLIRLRRDAAFRADRRGQMDGAVLAPQALLLRFFTDDPVNGRIVIVNLGPDLRRASFAEPLLAPLSDRDWHVRWSSEDPLYAGGGTPSLRPEGAWHIAAECAVVLAPDGRRELPTLETPRRTA